MTKLQNNTESKVDSKATTDTGYETEEKVDTPEEQAETEDNNYGYEVEEEKRKL